MKGKLASVLLVLLLLLTAWGTKETPSGGTTRAVSLDVPMAGGRLAGVDALWAGGSGEQARGGTSAMTITIDRYPPEERRIRVGFFQEFAGAADDQWRASGGRRRWSPPTFWAWTYRWCETPLRPAAST